MATQATTPATQFLPKNGSGEIDFRKLPLSQRRRVLQNHVPDTQIVALISKPMSPEKYAIIEEERRRQRLSKKEKPERTPFSIEVPEEDINETFGCQCFDCGEPGGEGFLGDTGDLSGIHTISNPRGFGRKFKAVA